MPSDTPIDGLERMRPYLTLLARAHLGQRRTLKIDASDIVQQTMLNAIAGWGQFRGTSDGELLAWLRQILVHQLADAIRQQQRGKRDVRLERSLEAAIDDSFSHVDQWLAAVQSSPSQRVANEEDLLRLSEALAHLPDAQRDAIVLHHLQGLKLADVAREIGRTEASVAGLLFRGLRALQGLLQE